MCGERRPAGDFDADRQRRVGGDDFEEQVSGVREDEDDDEYRFDREERDGSPGHEVFASGVLEDEQERPRDADHDADVEKPLQKCRRRVTVDGGGHEQRPRPERRSDHGDRERYGPCFLPVSPHGAAETDGDDRRNGVDE